uniref:RNA polymerase sigma factor sigA n=2 Tax=Rhizophora mucronata TaxID=61149 RepID=A0A2P2MK75_RHIMU
MVSCLYESAFRLYFLLLQTRFCTCTRDNCFPLVASRKQGATASCKTCGGRPSSDGIEVVGSASTMSTGGLELTKYINPDLTWKTVAKGYRSSLGRTRKAATRKPDVGVELSDEVSRKADAMSVSDNEKNGVAVLGHHFSEEIEHVPIKKRRIITQPPAIASQFQSSCFEVTEPSSSGKRRHKGTDPSKITKFTGRMSGVNDSTCDYAEDFSGIEILAAVACNNSLFNHVDNDEESSPREESTQAGVGSSTSAVPAEETIASSNDPANVGKFEASVPEDSSVVIFHKSPTTKDTRNVEVTTSLQDERLLWDLNAVPGDNLSADSQVDAQHIICAGEMSQDIGSNEAPAGPNDSSKNPQDGLVPLETHAKGPSSTDLKGLPCSPYRSSVHQVEEDYVLHSNCNKFVMLTSGVAREPLMCDVADMKASHEIVDTDDCSRAGICMKNEGTSASGLTVNQNTEVYSSVTQVEKISSIKGPQIEGCHAPLSHLPELERASSEIGNTSLNEVGEESRRTPGLLEDQKSFQSMTRQEDESGDRHCSQNNGDVSASSESGVEGQHGVTVEVKKEANGISGTNTAGVESPEATGSEELVQKSYVDSTATHEQACKGHDNRLIGSLDKVVTEDPSDESYGSDVYQSDKVEISVTKNSVELQAGYDSQFEDGELRESDTQYCWDENEEEEIEHVDYGSECDEKAPCSFGGEEMRVERGSSPGSDSACKKAESCGTGDAARDNSVSPKTRVLRVTTGKDFPPVVAGSRESDRELPSSAKVPDASHRKDVALTSRDGGIYDIPCRDGRAATSKKFIGMDKVASHMRGRSPGGHRCVNPSVGYWESEGQYLPTYPGAYSSRSTRPKSVIGNHGYMMDSEHIASSMARFGGFDRRSHKQVNYSDSHNGYERDMRRSLVNRDYVDFHGGRLPFGEARPTRNRFRRSQQGFGRGIREEYHKRLPLENIGYSNRESHRLARRERSISPLDRVPLHYAAAYRESRSRSRSRSPAAYVLRERCERSRLRSRSPNLRSDTRIERPRLPFHKHITVGYEEDPFSPPRSNFSSQHNSRWYDDRKGASDSYRGRKSTRRMFQPSQRFETVHSIRRLNTDEQFRPMMQSRKFPDKGTTGREIEYEDSDDDRRKRSSRYEVVYRARRYDTDGTVRRLQRNADDSLAVKDAFGSVDCSRVTDRSRDALRRPSEE